MTRPLSKPLELITPLLPTPPTSNLDPNMQTPLTPNAHPGVACSTASRRKRRFGALLATTVAALPLLAATLPLGCQGQPAAVPVSAATGTATPSALGAGVDAEASRYETAPPDQRERPPEAGPVPHWQFPQIHTQSLENGLSIRSVERPTLPLVEIRLLLRSGTASDGRQPGVALLAGEMLKVGGSGKLSGPQLLDKVESLGSNLSVITGRDSTSVSISVTSDRFDEAMDLLGLIVAKPRFDKVEFDKLRSREIDRVRGMARSSAGWAAQMALNQYLFESEKADHPYARYDASVQALEKRNLWQAKNWARQHVTPGNAVLVLTGRVTQQQARTAAERAFQGWKGKAPQALTFPALKPVSATRLLLVDRPKSPQAEVLVASLGPAKRDPAWTQLKVATQVVGGGVSGRLFLDVREKRSLAYSTYASLGATAAGLSPLILKAGTQTAKAGLALQALLEHATAIGAAAPNAEESQIATQYLSDAFLLRMEAASSVAGMVANLSLLGLPDTYYDSYRAAVRATTPLAAQQAAQKYLVPERLLIVVAGDAARLAGPLSHFAPVEVLAPEKEFKVVQTLPHNPAATIELPRLDGT